MKIERNLPNAIDVTDAQLIKHANEVHVMGQTGQIVLSGKYAETVWAYYEEQKQTGAGKFDMRLQIPNRLVCAS
jgi:hypothetical protein